MNFVAKLATLAASALIACPLSAQWQTTVYSLKGGWNSIHLTGDAKQDEIGVILPESVLEVWRWNPNPAQVQFTSSPLIPSAGTPEWSVWRRGEPENSSLSQLTGQSSYLVKCAGSASTTYSIPLTQSPLLPANQWVRNGANLMGFPTYLNGANYPLMSSYFATFPVAVATSTKIYKYIGGDLSPSNPLQVFSPTMERMDRTKAYWFSSEVVGNFIGPIEISLSNPTGLRYGRSSNVVTGYFRNRTSAPVTLTFTPVSSESPPPGQPLITGSVPLTRRTFNTANLTYTETPISVAINEVIPPQTTVEISFGVNRAHPSISSAADDAYFASFLRVTDSSNLMDVYLPASASKASLAGLWVGDVVLKQVSNSATPAGNTPQEFPLRTLLHLSSSGTATLLSKVFIGKLVGNSNELGLCTNQSLLDPASLNVAQRLVSAHLPLDQALAVSSASFQPGQNLVFTVQIPYNDVTNPFVHQYHPDHDNKDPRGQQSPAGVESYNIVRNCTFSFTSLPPAGSTVTSGWGSSTIGGTYREVISGLHKLPITLTGTFELRRASESGTLYIP